LINEGSQIIFQFNPDHIFSISRSLSNFGSVLDNIEQKNEESNNIYDLITNIQFKKENEIRVVLKPRDDKTVFLFFFLLLHFLKNAENNENPFFHIDCKKTIIDLYNAACKILRIDNLKVLLTPWEYDERLNKVLVILLKLIIVFILLPFFFRTHLILLKILLS
jgi:hypothetical protein